MSVTWAILPWDAVVVWKPLFLHFLHFLWLRGSRANTGLSHPSLMSSIQTSLHFFHNHWLIISLLEAIYLLSFLHLVLGAFWDKENHHWASGRHTLTYTHCQGNEEECRSDVPVIKSTEFGLLKRNILSSLQVCMFVMCMCECMG